MSEALRLADKSDALANEGSLIHLQSWSYIHRLLRDDAEELRRLANVEAELQQAREERTALLATEQNLREELAALRAAVPELCDPSCGTYDLASMILSDCGHSSNNQRLLDRVAARIDKRLAAVLEASPQAPQADPGADDELAAMLPILQSNARETVPLTAAEVEEAESDRGYPKTDATLRGSYQTVWTAPQAAQPVQPSEQVRKPLSDAEIDDLARETVKGGKSVNWLARAVERAHNIREN